MQNFVVTAVIAILVVTAIGLIVMTRLVVMLLTKLVVTFIIVSYLPILVQQSSSGKEYKTL